MVLNIFAFLTVFSNFSFPQTKTNRLPFFMSLYFVVAARVSIFFLPDLISRKLLRLFLLVVLKRKIYLFIMYLFIKPQRTNFSCCSQLIFASCVRIIVNLI